MPLDRPPFPPLSWDGFSWTGRAIVPEFPGGGMTVIRVCVAQKPGMLDEAAAPRPSVEQEAAYRFLLGDGAGVREALLTAVRDRVPEWAEWSLVRIAGEVRLDHLTVHATSWDGVAYIGYWLSPAGVDTWLTEHGAGVTAHRYRVASFGVGEESRSETAAAADVRRLRRSDRG